MVGQVALRTDCQLQREEMGQGIQPPKEASQRGRTRHDTPEKERTLATEKVHVEGGGDKLFASSVHRCGRGMTGP